MLIYIQTPVGWPKVAPKNRQARPGYDRDLSLHTHELHVRIQHYEECCKFTSLGASTSLRARLPSVKFGG
jgi:hypothetical protein